MDNETSARTRQSGGLAQAFQNPYLTIAIMWTLSTVVVVACIFGLPDSTLDRNFEEILTGAYGAALFGTVMILFFG